MKNTKIKRMFLCVSVFAILIVSTSNSLSAQTIEDREKAAAAMEHARNGRNLEALPIFEEVIDKFPGDAELWANYGIAILIKATTILDRDERQALQKKGLRVLAQAKILGTNNPRALDMLDQFSNSDGSDNFENENPEVEAALRAGEALFASGKYELAFAEYKKAHELDPKNYEAVLFMGDCYYALRRYPEAIPYFQQAVDIDPKRSMAHLFWGDALFYDGKFEPALDKFLDVLIRDPFSNTSWTTLQKWGDGSGNEYSIISISPPGNESTEPVLIDPVLLKRSDGTDSWLSYVTSVGMWIDKSGESDVRFTIADEERAWKAVADSYKQAKSTGRVTRINSDLENLVRLNEDGLLLPYLYLIRGRESFSADYDEVMKNDGLLVRRFIRKYFFNLEEKADIGYE